MPTAKTIDFDARSNSKDGDRAVLTFLNSFFDHARDFQRQKHEEWQRIYRLYKNKPDLSNRDPNRSNLFFPLLFANVETIVPHYVDALLGVRPYIPIRLLHDQYADIGDIMTDVLDGFLDDEESNFEGAVIDLIKYVTLFGTGYIEAAPDYRLRNITSVVPVYSDDGYGGQVQVGSRVMKEAQYFMRLKCRAYAPWEIYKDPYAKTLKDCRGIIKFRGMTSKRQLRKMAERGAFPEFDADKLDMGIAEAQEDNWTQRIASDLGVKLPKTDDDMGVWLSYESEDRYIDYWNFNTVIRDKGNPYDVRQGGHGQINLTRVINTNDPHPLQSFWGIGEGRPVEELIHAINENWNQTFDNHNMLNQGVLFYDEDSMNVDQLVMIAGNRVPVNPGAGKSIDDVVQERKTPGLSRDHYAIPEKLETIFDRTTGVHEITRGETSIKEQTAREAIMKRQAGESRMKLKIRMGEQMGLKDFGLKALQIIDQFATQEDLIEKVGVERAMMIGSMNPMAQNGGWKFAFNGSGRLADALAKRQDAKDLFQLMANYPFIDQQWLGNFILERFDVSEQERRKAVYGVQQGLMMQAALAQAGAASQGESTRAVSNGSVFGGSGGNRPTGRDNSEKLGISA